MLGARVPHPSGLQTTRNQTRGKLLDAFPEIRPELREFRGKADLHPGMPDIRQDQVPDGWRLRCRAAGPPVLETTRNYVGGMKAVGVKQLKARLSEYLRLVRSGETILVTDPYEVIAELRPGRRQPRPAEDVEETLDRLAETGEITRASVPKSGWTWKVKGLGLPAGTAQALLDEVRGERV